jgi:hypothetical protein
LEVIWLMSWGLGGSCGEFRSTTDLWSGDGDRGGGFFVLTVVEIFFVLGFETGFPFVPVTSAGLLRGDRRDGSVVWPLIASAVDWTSGLGGGSSVLDSDKTELSDVVVFCRFGAFLVLFPARLALVADRR